MAYGLKFAGFPGSTSESVVDHLDLGTSRADEAETLHESAFVKILVVVDGFDAVIKFGVR